MAKKTGGGGVSLRTKDAVEGGGTEGALATITEIGWVDEFTYGGTQKGNPAAALHVIFDIPDFKKPWDQHYSAGPSSKWEVIADGDGIKSLGKSAGLNKKSPAYYFMEAVEEAAASAKLDIDELLPELEDGGHSVRPLEGRQVRLTNIKREIVGGDLKEYTVISEFVGNGNGASKSGKLATASAKTSSKGSSGDDVEAKTVAAVMALIEEHTSVKVNNLANLVYDANRKDPDAKAMMQLTFRQTWVADPSRPWHYDRKRGLLQATE